MKKIFLLVLIFSLSTSIYSQKNKYAKDIKVEIDKYDGTTTWRSPSLGKGLKAMMVEPIQLVKTKDKEGVYRTYLRLMSYGMSVSVDGTGAVLLFQDGDRIENETVEIDVNVESVATAYARYNYVAFFPVGEEELQKLATKTVDGFKLYIYENNLYGYGNKAKEKIKGWAQAIMDAK